jgi:tryptophan 2,3-dioxygenase
MIEFTPEMLDNMTPADFEAYLPELFAVGSGKISDDPRFAHFLAANPDCAALVRDLETIAEHARSLFDPVEEPSDKVWSNIASKLQAGLTDEDDLDTGTVAVPTT